MRTIGRKEPAISLKPRAPTREERAWIKSLASKCRLQVPKGVFRYASSAAMSLEWENWMADTIIMQMQNREESKISRPATWEDLLHVVRLLQKHEVKFILVGGYALLTHGYNRATIDIDIGVAPDFENSRRWILALSEMPDGVAKELIDEVDPFEGDYNHAIRINDEITIDIMPSVSGMQYEELLEHVDFLKFEDVKIPVLDLEGLYKAKKNSLRPKDQADAQVLKNALQKANIAQGFEAKTQRRNAVKKNYST